MARSTRWKKTTIRPPRAPKGEDPEVTIANNKLGIKLLIERVQVLTKERDEALKELQSVADLSAQRATEIESHKSCGQLLCDKIAEMEKAHIRLQGWQDCAREMIESLTMQKP